MVILEILHPPVSWVPSRVSKNGTYDPRQKIKKAFKNIIASQYKGPIITDPVCVRMQFIFTPPKSVTKKSRADMLEQMLIPTKSDCTNLQKLYEDCLKGIVIKDDRQVAMILSEKAYGEVAKVMIIVKKLFTDGEC
jgi:Holliday junction resolvase RusA-like endonuclease